MHDAGWTQIPCTGRKFLPTGDRTNATSRSTSSQHHDLNRTILRLVSIHVMEQFSTKENPTAELGGTRDLLICRHGTYY